MIKKMIKEAVDGMFKKPRSLPKSFTELYRGRGDKRTRTPSPMDQWNKNNMSSPPVVLKEKDGEKYWYWVNRAERRLHAALGRSRKEPGQNRQRSSRGKRNKVRTLGTSSKGGNEQPAQ